MLYKETLDSYEKALDNRLIEGISRSSGQGKQLTFTVFYYKKAWVKEVVLQASNEPYLRNDTLFSVQEKMVLPASVHRFKTQEVYTTREKFFTVEDIMHLEGNN